MYNNKKHYHNLSSNMATNNYSQIMLTNIIAINSLFIILYNTITNTISTNIQVPITTAYSH